MGDALRILTSVQLSFNNHEDLQTLLPLVGNDVKALGDKYKFVEDEVDACKKPLEDYKKLLKQWDEWNLLIKKRMQKTETQLADLERQIVPQVSALPVEDTRYNRSSATAPIGRLEPVLERAHPATQLTKLSKSKEKTYNTTPFNYNSSHNSHTSYQKSAPISYGSRVYNTPTPVAIKKKVYVYQKDFPDITAELRRLCPDYDYVYWQVGDNVPFEGALLHFEDVVTRLDDQYLPETIRNLSRQWGGRYALVPLFKQGSSAMANFTNMDYETSIVPGITVRKGVYNGKMTNDGINSGYVKVIAQLALKELLLQLCK